MLTTPFDVDAHQMPPAYMADVSPTQSRWTSREPPASSRKVSGTTDATGPGECASHHGSDHEAPVRLETGWDQSPRERETPNCFFGGVSDTTSALTHATMNTAVFDATLEYCTHDIVLIWLFPSCFSLWTLPRFTVEGISYSCSEQFFAAKTSRFFKDHQILQHIMRTFDPRLHQEY